MTTALERGEWSAARPGRSLPPGKTQYPLYRGPGGPQGRSGQVRKISPLTGIRSPDLPARSSVAIPTELPGPLSRQEFRDISNSPIVFKRYKTKTRPDPEPYLQESLCENFEHLTVALFGHSCSCSSVIRSKYSVQCRWKRVTRFNSNELTDKARRMMKAFGCQRSDRRSLNPQHWLDV